MRIGVCGTGKAGKEMIRRIVQDDKYELAMVLNRRSSADIGKDVGDLIDGYTMNMYVTPVEDAVRMVKENSVDVIIDFSGKETTVELLQIMSGQTVDFVICTTNYGELLWEKFMNAIPSINGSVVYAPTLTVGINLLINYVERLSRVLPDFDFEIIERHKKGKPCPTTTAKRIAESIDRESVNISSVRAGGYVGIHEVTAANENERITIVHESFTRAAFANGALIAAEFGHGKKGFFEMRDVITEMEEKALK